MAMEAEPCGQFPPSRRLRKRRDYVGVQSQGRRQQSSMFVVCARSRQGEAATGPGRLGITVTKRVGPAVRRNRIRRLVREFARLSCWIPDGVDVVVIAKRGARRAFGLSDVRADLEPLWENLR